MEKLFSRQTFQDCPLLEWFIWLSNLHEMCYRLKIVKNAKQDSNGYCIEEVYGFKSLFERYLHSLLEKTLCPSILSLSLNNL